MSGMMKSFNLVSTIACTLVLLACIKASSWGVFEGSHRKRYGSVADEWFRRIGPVCNRLVNDFHSPQSIESGWSQEVKPVRESSLEAQRFLEELVNRAGALPAQVDWRKMGNRVTAVKDQGHCVAGWAFATAGALEAQEVARNASSRLIELSPQNLIDCVAENQACLGGSMKNAFRFVAKTGGIDEDGVYSYEGVNGKCRGQSKISFALKGAFVLPEGDEGALQKVVARFGPVGVSIDSKGAKFRNYKTGVYHDEMCKSKLDELNHNMLLVGYGTDSHHGDYWILKNSWGESWGQRGYMLLARNRNNHCGVATAATGPYFA